MGLGLPEPHHAAMPRLKSISNGMKRWQKIVGKLNTKNRLPITPVILFGIKQQWAHRASEYDIIMYWAVVCMAFFGFFRLGEIILPTEESYNPCLHISAGDVRLDNTADPSVIQIHLKRSKTDQYGHRTMVYLGRSSNALCPIAAISAFMVVRGASPGPFFMKQDGTPLSKQTVIKQVQKAISAMGVNPEAYTGHSFRIGAATAAAHHGLQDSTIQMLGRWTSDAFRAYIHTPREQLAAFSATISNIPDL